MIYKDAFGFPVDQTGDAGDSAVRAGILKLFDRSAKIPINLYEQNGFCVRHPNQAPWSSPDNFSRDQLIPLAAALPQTAARRVFWAHAKRFFFCQNIERDWPGSRKFLWPHRYWKDSNPNSGITEKRWTNYRDILMPDQIWHLILCARLWPLYWFGLVGIPWLLLSIIGHSLSLHKEHNQIVSQCKVQGQWALALFKVFNPDWKEELRRYWGRRNEIEYADLIIKKLTV